MYPGQREAGHLSAAGDTRHHHRHNIASTQIFYHTVNIFTSPHINIFCCVNNFAGVQRCIYLSCRSCMRAPGGGNIGLGQAPGAATPHLSLHPPYSAFCSFCPFLHQHSLYCVSIWEFCRMPLILLCTEAGAAPGPAVVCSWCQWPGCCR